MAIDCGGTTFRQISRQSGVALEYVFHIPDASCASENPGSIKTGILCIAANPQLGSVDVSDHSGPKITVPPHFFHVARLYRLRGLVHFLGLHMFSSVAPLEHFAETV